VCDERKNTHKTDFFKGEVEHRLLSSAQSNWGSKNNFFREIGYEDGKWPETELGASQKIGLGIGAFPIAGICSFHAIITANIRDIIIQI
jgi:hypothetical protein